eukprot:1160229-Pelagomonas_calceolata.AAC.8
MAPVSQMASIASSMALELVAASITTRPGCTRTGPVARDRPWLRAATRNAVLAKSMIWGSPGWMPEPVPSLSSSASLLFVWRSLMQSKGRHKCTEPAGHACCLESPISLQYFQAAVAMLNTFYACTCIRGAHRTELRTELLIKSHHIHTMACTNALPPVDINNLNKLKSWA